MSEIKPALTAAEWATWLGDGARVPEMVDQCYNAVFGGRAVDGSRHAQGAVALHEQPFGFRREDAFMHREAAHACVTSGQTIGPGSTHAWHISMAERLDALLPPERTIFRDCKFVSPIPEENHGSSQADDRARDIAQHTEE